MSRMRTIHHGIDLKQYILRPKKQEYLAFLGRIAPLKGTHTAIEVAKKERHPPEDRGRSSAVVQGLLPPSCSWSCSLG